VVVKMVLTGVANVMFSNLNASKLAASFANLIEYIERSSASETTCTSTSRTMAENTAPRDSAKRQPVRMFGDLRHGQRHGFKLQVHTICPRMSECERRTIAQQFAIRGKSILCNAIRRALYIALLVLLFAAGRLACAQNTPPFPLDHKDAWEISVRAGEFGVINRGGELLTTAAIRYGVVLTDPFGKGRLRGTLEYTLDWLPMILMTRPSLIYGAGVLPLGFKFNYLANPRHRPFWEGNFGGTLSTHSLPPGNSTLNLNVNAGGGLTLLNRGAETLTVSFQYSHLSCGFFCSRNPNLNGASIVLEYHWLKPK
jgi:hypothetical protein